MFYTEHFCQETFTNLQKENNEIYQLKKALTIFKMVSERYAPIGTCFIQANHGPFTKKDTSEGSNYISENL